MLRPFKWFLGIAVLLAVAGLLMLPERGSAQAPANAAADTKVEQQTLQQLLDHRLETRNFQIPDMKFKEFAGILYQIFDKKGMALPIIIDVEAFRSEDPEITKSDIYDAFVSFPPFPPEMTVATAFGMAVKQIPSKNATYVLMGDHILVTTWAKTTVESKLNEKIRGVYEKCSLESALRDLSDKVGVTITMDARAAAHAKKEVSASFRNDISLAGALRVLTEMADLKVAVVDGAIFVTTPAHAETLRKEVKRDE